MKKLFYIGVFLSILISCSNSTDNKKENFNVSNVVVENETQNITWSEDEKKAFINQCVQGSSSNPNLTSSQINSFCRCCLDEMMIKYNQPTSDIDMDWFKETSNKCMSENINK